jgi:hypothetical protein
VGSKASSELRRLKSGLAKVRALRQTIRHGTDQARRDAAIVEYTRTLDDIVECLLEIEAAGGFDAPAGRDAADKGRSS